MGVPFMRHVFAAVVVLLLLPRLATAAVSLSLLPVDASALGNFESHDLQVSTDNDWTTAAMVVQLTTGQVHHDGAGTDPPTRLTRVTRKAGAIQST